MFRYQSIARAWISSQVSASFCEQFYAVLPNPPGADGSRPDLRYDEGRRTGFAEPQVLAPLGGGAVEAAYPGRAAAREAQLEGVEAGRTGEVAVEVVHRLADRELELVLDDRVLAALERLVEEELGDELASSSAR